MVWQDIVITIASIVFSVALVPQVIAGFKDRKGFVTLAASIPTTLGLYVLSFTYLSLNLSYSAVTAFLTGTLWWVLFMQRLVFKKA